MLSGTLTGRSTILLPGCFGKSRHILCQLTRTYRVLRVWECALTCGTPRPSMARRGGPLGLTRQSESAPNTVKRSDSSRDTGLVLHGPAPAGAETGECAGDRV